MTSVREAAKRINARESAINHDDVHDGDVVPNGVASSSAVDSGSNVEVSLPSDADLSGHPAKRRPRNDDSSSSPGTPAPPFPLGLNMVIRGRRGGRPRARSPRPSGGGDATSNNHNRNSSSSSNNNNNNNYPVPSMLTNPSSLYEDPVHHPHHTSSFRRSSSRHRIAGDRDDDDDLDDLDDVNEDVVSMGTSISSALTFGSSHPNHPAFHPHFVMPLGATPGGLPPPPHHNLYHPAAAAAAAAAAGSATTGGAAASSAASGHHPDLGSVGVGVALGHHRHGMLGMLAPPSAASAADAADNTHANNGGSRNGNSDNNNNNNGGGGGGAPAASVGELLRMLGGGDDTTDNSDDTSVNFTGLHKLCYNCEGEDDPRWDTVLKFLRDLATALGEEEAQRVVETEQKGIIPLFLACERQPPKRVVDALIDASPRTLAMTDELDYLPIHIACNNDANEDVLRVLVDRHPDPAAAKEALTTTGTTPLQLLIYENNSRPPTPAMFAILMTPKVMLLKDQFGNTPLKTLMKYVHSVDSADSAYTTHTNHKKKAMMDKCRRILDAYLNLRPYGTPDLLTHVRSLPDWLMDHVLAHRHMKQIINRRISRRAATVMLMTNAYVQAGVIVAYTAAVLNTTSRRDRDPGDGWLAALCVLVLYLAYRKLLQLASISLRNWVRNPFNWLDALQIYMLASSVVILSNGDVVERAFLGANATPDSLFYTQDEQPGFLVNISFNDFSYGRATIICTGGLNWIMMISLLKSTYLPFSIFIGGALDVCRALIPFNITILFLLGSFSLMLYIDVNTSVAGVRYCRTRAETLANATAATAASRPEIDGFPVLETSYCSLYDLHGAAFKIFSIFISSAKIDVEDIEYYFTRFLSNIFSLLVRIVILSLLLAIVLSAYIRMEPKGENIFWRNRLDFVIEVQFSRQIIKRATRLLRLPRGRNREEVDDEDDDDDDSLLEDKKYLDNYHECNSSDFQTNRRIVWDILCISFLPHYGGDGEMLQEEKVLAAANGGRYARMLREPLWKRRARAFFVVPLWSLSGFLTLGITWPPQVREYLLCSNINYGRGSLVDHVRDRKSPSESRRRSQDTPNSYEGDNDYNGGGGTGGGGGGGGGGGTDGDDGAAGDAATDAQSSQQQRRGASSSRTAASDAMSLRDLRRDSDARFERVETEMREVRREMVGVSERVRRLGEDVRTEMASVRRLLTSIDAALSNNNNNNGGARVRV